MCFTFLKIHKCKKHNSTTILFAHDFIIHVSKFYSLAVQYIYKYQLFFSNSYALETYKHMKIYNKSKKSSWKYTRVTVKLTRFSSKHTWVVFNYKLSCSTSYCQTRANLIMTGEIIQLDI